MAKIPTSWKSFERRIAKRLGGQRRGAHTGSGGKGTGKTDVIHDHFAIECKLLGAPTYSAIVAACKQAEDAAEEGQEPIAIVKRKSAQDNDALVCMRLETFTAWRIANDDRTD